MKILNWVRLVGVLILLICSSFTSINAQTEGDSKHLLFNSKAAFARLDGVKGQPIVKPSDLPAANLSLEKIEKLRGDAEICVEKANAQLTILQKLLDNIQSIKGKSPVEKKDEFKYLEDKKDYYTQQTIDCRIFLFQSQEVLTGLRGDIQKINTQVKLKRATPAWSLLGIGEVLFNDFDSQKFYQVSGISNFTTGSLIGLFALIIISLSLAFFIRHKCSGWLNKRIEKQKVSVTLVTVTKHYIIPMLLTGTISGYLAILFFVVNPSPLIEYISYAFFIYSMSLAFLNLLFLGPRPLLPIIPEFQNYGRSLFIRLTVLLTFFFITSLIFITFINQDLSSQLVEMARSFFLVLLSVNVVWISWLFASLPFLAYEHKKSSIFIKIILVTLIFIIIITQALGYYRLSSDVIFGAIYILLALAAFYVVSMMVGGIELILNNRESGFSKVIRQHLGVEYSKDITEFLFIKIAIYIYAAYGFTLIVLMSFGASLNYIDKLNIGFMDGIVLGKIKIIPFQIILALFIFGTQLILGRWLKNIIIRKHKLQNKKDTQDAMASLFSYLNFFLALIVALIVTGIDLTSLTVVVGALSVGIGLGLQDIVNNFISGIILLVEKPIKSGDRILIDGQDGFVKKIRLRSTRIKTMSRKDVIIPNLNFITQKITNYTYSNEQVRVSCKVGVSYDSDVDLVKNTLLELAAACPDAVQDEVSKPTVFFTKFSESSMDFEVYFTVANVNKVFSAVSDVNTMIYKEFKNRNIEIANPQLDVHFRKPKIKDENHILGSAGPG
ncbi:MAG: mechanosensitive ion channel [Gammaproteobacteria bacterium]|nr:mechanosensitive ion channel [Gammaproteobacteria bacterium]